MSNTTMSILSQEKRDEVKALVAKNNTIAAYIRNSKNLSDKVVTKLTAEIDANKVTINTITGSYKRPRTREDLFAAFTLQFPKLKKVESIVKEQPIIHDVIEEDEEIEIDNEPLPNEYFPESFKNPDTGIYESADEYLTGFVRKKLIKAEFAVQEDRSFMVNIEALKKVIPEDIPSDLISYTLGSAWIPDGIYETFAKKLFACKVEIKYHSKLGRFHLYTTSNNANITNTYSAGGKNAIDILSATMNNKLIDIIETELIDGKRKTSKNVERTAAAQGMQQLMQDKFEEFMRDNDECFLLAERLYNQIFNGYIPLRFPCHEGKYEGASDIINLRMHQRNGVARGLKESTLFAHEVGSGKSPLIMTTAMEMRRQSIAKKPLVVVQNSTRGQFYEFWKQLYPNSKIFSPSEKQFNAKNRENLYRYIAENDFDAVLIPHSQLSIIPDDFRRQKKYIKEEIVEFEDALFGVDKKDFQYRHMKSEINKLNDDLHNLIDQNRNPTKYTFENMGFDAILIDEFHHFKRLGFRTNMKNIKGIDTSKSKRSQSVLLKMRWVQEKNGGRNTLGYTGTPISNTMAEAWTMVKYFRPDILDHMGINNFDQFAKTFGQIVPSLEQTGGGTYKIQSRFAKFQNLPELMNMFKACTDVVLSEDVQEFKDENILPKLKTGSIIQNIITQSPELKDQIKEFREKLEWFDELEGIEKRINCHIPLVIYGKAKQASIDLRLLNPTNTDSKESKLNKCVQNALELYRESTATKGVQMIFCDLYQSPEPKEEYLDEDCTMLNPAFGMKRFNLFEDIQEKLINAGVPAHEIAIMNDPKYESVDQKMELFKKVIRGAVRFLLGTTAKMGVGVNVQDLLIGLHHLDAPLRPLEFTQRNGRIQRPGNKNEWIYIFAYGVEKTLDSSAFQRLAIKQKFINQIMRADNLDRIMDDAADEVQVTFDEMMALLSDSPYAMQKLMVDNGIRTERMKLDNFNSRKRKNIYDLKDSVEEMASLSKSLERTKSFCDIINEKIPEGNISIMVISGEEHLIKFGEAANEYIDIMHSRFKVSATNHAIGSIVINDLKVEIEFKAKEEYSKKSSSIALAELYYKIPEIGLNGDYFANGIRVDSGTGLGMISSIRKRLAYILEEPFQISKNIKAIKSNIPILQKETEAVFDNSKLLELEKESEMLAYKMMAGDAKYEEA